MEVATGDSGTGDGRWLAACWLADWGTGASREPANRRLADWEAGWGLVDWEASWRLKNPSRRADWLLAGRDAD